MSINEKGFKIIICVSIVVLLSLFNGYTFEKSAATGDSTGKNTYCELKTFTAQYAQGKMYINWIVNTNISNYYFIVEKSNDNSKFTTIQIVKGVPSPVKEGLLFGYIECDVKRPSRIYRLQAIQLIKSGNAKPLHADNKNLFKGLAMATIETNSNTTSNHIH